MAYKWTRVGYYLSVCSRPERNDCIKSGYAKFYNAVKWLGSTDTDTGTTFMVQMYKGPTEVHAYHHTLRPGDESSAKLTRHTRKPLLQRRRPLPRRRHLPRRLRLSRRGRQKKSNLPSLLQSLTPRRSPS